MPPTLPPLSIADLLTLIGEQQVRIVQLARALEAAQAEAAKEKPQALDR